MPRIKEKISKLVASQLPEFIQSDYPTFIAFLEAYYEFLEQDQQSQELLQNAISYRDIDRTTSEFIDYFIKEYCDNIPRDVLSDKTLLVKYIKDLYTFKGSEKSYYLLFQLLYKEKVDLYYPKEDILTPSSGTWQQTASIQVETLDGNPNDAINVPGLIYSTQTVTPIVLLNKKTVTAVTNPLTGAISTSDKVFDFEIDNRKNVPVTVGDIIEVQGYRGRVLALPVDVTVSKAGSGFKIGDTFEVQSFPTGIGAYVKITGVDNSGGVKNAELLRVGSGYSLDFFSTIISQPSVITPSFTFNTQTGNVVINDNSVGVSDFGSISKPTYADGSYVAGDYCDEVVAVFKNVPPSRGGGQYYNAESIYEAVLKIKVGAKVLFPGFYRTNKGFLSDSTINIADANYYTPYSYVVVSNKRLQDYKKAILDILHPAGTNLIGELRMLNEIDTIPSVATTFDYLRTTVLDIFTTADSNAKQVTKVRSSNTTPNDSVFAKDFTKVNESNLTFISSYDDNKLLRSLTRPLQSNSIPLDDSFVTNISAILNTINLVGDNASSNIEIIRGDSGDLLTSHDNTIVSINTVYESNLTVLVANTIATVGKVLSSTQASFDANIITDISKVLVSNLPSLDNLVSNISIVRGAGVDNVTPNDIAAISITIPQFDNISSPLDVLINSVTKVLKSNTIPLDNVLKDINIVKNSNTTPQDAIVFSLVENLTSNTTPADSGSIFLMNYTDNFGGPSAYFAEQYAGELTTF